MLQDITEENFTEVRARMLETLEVRIERLNDSKALCLEYDNEEKAEWFDTRLVELQAFYEEVVGASNAEELEDAIFVHVKENMLEALDMKLEKLEARKEALNESENEAAIAKLEEQISELEELREALSEAEYIETLEKIKFLFAKEQMLEMLERQTERLEDKIAGLGETDNNNLINEKLEARIAQLEELKDSVSYAESPEELKEVRAYFWNLGGKSLKNGPGNGLGNGHEKSHMNDSVKHAGRNGPKTIQ